MKNKSIFKGIFKVLLCALLIIVIAAVSYVSYVLIAYHRIEDNLSLEITDGTTEVLPTNKEFKALSYNIGFCAYTQDFSFFMDGGESSRAKSEESVYEVLSGIETLLKNENADIVMMQEVDKNSTRSHHIDQQAYIADSMSSYDSIFSINYDSPYLLYPFLEPHGKSVSGMLTMSKYDIDSSIRRSLPIETSLMKLVDLDRCYSVSRIRTDNDKQLVLYTVHLSAYTSDGTIATQQLKLLIEDMKAECENGNYVICAGDFNKDLLMDSGSVFGVSDEEYTWAQAFPTDMLSSTSLSLVAPFDEKRPVASCRNTDEPYRSEGQFNVTLDGFIVSDNIDVSKADVIDTKFMYSDHNPVYMTFTLKG